MVETSRQCSLLLLLLLLSLMRTGRCQQVHNSCAAGSTRVGTCH
jgi:hypothetical protein